MNYNRATVATSNDSDYSLSIEGALALCARAGLPRTPRTIQRYCANGNGAVRDRVSFITPIAAANTPLATTARSCRPPSRSQ